MKLATLSDDAILLGVTKLLGSERKIVARLISYLVEVEERRLHLNVAASSLYDFCTRKLRWSEGESFRRINAARLAKRFPQIIGMLERGEIHLSTLVLLRDHLTEQNHDSLLADVAGKSKRTVQEYLAARFPQPDVPSAIRKLRAPAKPKPTASGGSPGSGVFSSAPRRAPARAVVAPLAPNRHRVQFTASSELRDKLELAMRRLSHCNPSSDIAVVVERAVDLLLADIEKTQLGSPTSTQPKPTGPTKTVTRAVRREVVTRDGEQCTFVSASGERCPARAFLEVDHVHPRALGGTAEASNLRVYCRAHNRLAAERVFGRAHVEAQIRRRRAAAAQAPTKEPPPKRPRQS
jgi:hypothetical protein